MRVRCITFASPRVGNIVFQREFDSAFKGREWDSVRVVHRRDLVPAVPSFL